MRPLVRSAAAALALFAGPARAQQIVAPPESPTPAPATTALPAPLPEKPVSKIPVLSGAPILDGVLDEPQWKEAAVLNGFTTFWPREGDEPAQRTTVYVYRDATHLFLAFDAEDSEPSKVRATYGDRDAILNDDNVSVIIDPFGSMRHAVQLLANPLGIQADSILSENSDDDYSWDTIYFSAGRLNGHGYTVEMSIPFASLRIDPSRDEWGLDVTRTVPRTNENSGWSPVRFAGGSFIRQLGRVTGMRGIEIGANVEIIPEITARSGHAADSGSGLAHDRPPHGLGGGASEGDAGLTAKISRGGIAADVAVNPDFSQVESDPGRVLINQRFPLSYDEKRPFFVEGKEQITLPWTVIYTRSIVDPLYGLKLTGKAGPTSFAILNAFDEHPAGSVVDPSWNPGAFHGNGAVTTLARTTTDVSDGATVGLTVVDKHVGVADNRVLGPDLVWQLSKTTTLVSQLLYAATDNPDRSAEEGSAFKVRFIHNDFHVQWFQWYEQTDSGFRAEAGFIPRVGYRETGIQSGYRLYPGGEHSGFFFRPFLYARVLRATINDDRNFDFQPSCGFNWGHSHVFVQPLQYAEERFHSTDFRSRRFYVEAASSYVKWIDLSVNASGGEQIAYFAPTPYLGSMAYTNVSATLKPVERLQLAGTYYRELFSASRSSDPKHFNEQGVYDASVLRATTLLFFTPALSSRVIAQWDTVAWKLSLSGLLSWRPGPGTIFYVGYQDARPGAHGVDVSQDRAVFVKMSYLWRG